MELLLLQLLNGLVSGAFYALLALGLALILSLTRIINLAHGGFLVVGAYLGYVLSGLWGFYWALLLAPLGLALLAVALEATLLRPLYRRDPLESLLLTFGLALVLEEVIRLVFGPVGVPFRIPEALGSPLFPGTPFFFLTRYRVLVIALALLAGLLVFLLLRYTRLGLYLRAGAQDREILSALGTDVGRLSTLAFALGAYLAGLAGVLAAGQLGLSPAMGTSLLMPSFVALILGGVGSLGGSYLGGLLVGMASGLAGQFAAAASEFAVYVILALVLLVRPRGLFGKEGFFE
ncbi:branched-chain amino acid ABC transporter permease [Thermus composti]|uniref:Branched-chain amino acid ABC transporter permease n=1 Tax=Thermus composti TaxID=532059 RepID=A0ABV6PZ82_9DEIN|nr:branched-chain amino acid ABC transporter permease [Thermus composti]GGN04455.1 branched-chain amino acid ABC transporter permease [Thermus composti]